MKAPLFRGLRELQWLNIGAVGLSLAAATAAVFALIMGSSASGSIALITGVPTLVIGALWAALLRWRRTVGDTSVRVGWLLSIPLAITNAGIAAALLLAVEPGRDNIFLRLISGLFLGMTFGVIFWLPALILTLLCFGLPIARAQGLAKQGLAGEERGERVVGATSALIAAAAMALTLAPASHDLVSGAWVVRVLGALAMIAGVAAYAIASAREQRRRDFVADVEAGKVERFRIDALPEGKVLVRIVSQGEGYRVADYAEEVAALDAEGSATRVGRE